MTRTATAQRPLSLLITCVGRRVELVQAFRAAARRRNIPLRIVASDSSPTAAALPAADVPVLVPAISDPGYIAALLDTVRTHEVTALIPTIDTDLQLIADHHAAFESLGCRPMVADPSIIRMCRDKVETFHFLRRAGIDTPETYTADAIRAIPEERRSYPYFIKPRGGSASVHVFRIEDAAELEFYLRKVRDPIVQEFVEGVEHTLDVYVGLSGRPRCVVPRARWQVRGREVVKGVVVKDREIMDAGRRVVEALGTSVRGLVTLQCIVTPARRIRFIEINPRFGGGAPLGIAAGAEYPGWLMEELLGGSPAIAFDGFRHGLSVSRYDWSTFVPLDDSLTPRLAPPLRPFPEFE